MTVIYSPDAARQAEVEPGVAALRTVIMPRGYGYSISAITGTMAAALTANATVFAARLDPSASANHAQAYIERIRLKWTTLVAFTTPITVGRRLELYRGSGAATSGGTAITPAAPKKGASDTSEMSSGNGGDMRIATTAGLTTTGITYETSPIRGMSLTHVGNAGNFYDCLWEFHATKNQPIVLTAGQLIAIRNPVAMDAAGTWQLQVDMDWYEAAAADYSG